MSEIDSYINKLEQPQKEEMERIRKLVREIAPEATEGMSYGMPAFKYQGKYLVGYATFKDHMSLFPASGPIETFKDRLAEHALSKGTIQFTPKTPLSEDIIRELVRARITEIDAR